MHTNFIIEATLQFGSKTAPIGAPMYIQRGFMLHGVWYADMGEYLRSLNDPFADTIVRYISTDIIYPDVVAELYRLYNHMCGNAVIPKTAVVVANIDWSHGMTHLHHVMAFALALAKYSDLDCRWTELLMIIVWIHDMQDRKYIQDPAHKADILEYIAQIGKAYGMPWLQILVQESARLLPYSSRRGVPADQQYRFNPAIITPDIEQAIADHYRMSVAEFLAAIKLILQIVADADMAHALFELLRIFVLAATRVNEPYTRWRNNNATIVEQIVHGQKDHYTTPYGKYFYTLMLPGAIAWRDAYAAWPVVAVREKNVVPGAPVRNVFATKASRRDGITYLKPSPPARLRIIVHQDTANIFANHPRRQMA